MSAKHYKWMENEPRSPRPDNSYRVVVPADVKRNPDPDGPPKDMRVTRVQKLVPKRHVLKPLKGW